MYGFLGSITLNEYGFKIFLFDNLEISDCAIVS
jgi:hypothetical protein